MPVFLLAATEIKRRQRTDKARIRADADFRPRPAPKTLHMLSNDRANSNVCVARGAKPNRLTAQLTAILQYVASRSLQV